MEFSKIRNILFLSALTIITVAFLYLVKPLFYPIFWAAVIASIFYPLYGRLRKKLKSDNLSSALILIMVFLIIVIPLSAISSLLIKESIDLYSELGTRGGQINTSVQNIIEWVKHNPFTSKMNINESFWVEKISQIAVSVSNFIFITIKNLTENSLAFIVMFVIMLYALFYFIKDGEKFLRKAMFLCPLGDNHEIIFYNKFTSTARAAIKSTLLIGLVQGTLGGLLFYVAGIKGALIWGLLMAFLAVIIGSYFVWVPAGIIMLALGNIWQGILILVFGILVISTIDNLLRPMLIGKDLKIHPLLIFLSTLGGLIVFGLSGFVIGPVITAFLITFWEMYEHYYKKELKNN